MKEMLLLQNCRACQGETQQERDISVGDKAGERRSRERQVGSETEIEGKLQQVEQCV